MKRSGLFIVYSDFVYKVNSIKVTWWYEDVFSIRKEDDKYIMSYLTDEYLCGIQEFNIPEKDLDSYFIKNSYKISEIKDTDNGLVYIVSYNSKKNRFRLFSSNEYASFEMSPKELLQDLENGNLETYIRKQKVLRDNKTNDICFNCDTDEFMDWLGVGKLKICRKCGR